MRKLVLIVSVLALSACSGDKTRNQVEMTDEQRFSPPSLVVQSGANVMFSNASDESHTVTFYSEGYPDGEPYRASAPEAEGEDEARDALADGLLRPGDALGISLKTPGTYRYFCIPHEGAGMKGTIVVE